MKILTDFDSGTAPPFEFIEKGIRFDLRPGQGILNLVIKDPSEDMNVDLLVDDTGETFIAGQGLVVSEDGTTFRPVPLTKIEDGVLRATIRARGDELQISSRYPYGRERLERLICDTSRHESITWRFLHDGQRGMPMAEFGCDDGHCPIHYFVAGEDAWETAGCWVVDEIVRELCRRDDPVATAAGKCVIRAIPLLSPYSATTNTPSYRTLAGARIYGAATWADPDTPPEYALLRELVENTIQESRLGFMMTIHSWQSARAHTELETIRSAGNNTLSKAREDWATELMQQMINGVPKGKACLPEKIWHPGLARDYLLSKHNVMTFRVEVTTSDLDVDGFRKTGRRFLSNLAAVSDWKNITLT